MRSSPQLVQVRPGLASVPHEVGMAAFGGIVRYPVAYLRQPRGEVIELNAAVKAAALHFDNLPRDTSSVAIWCSNRLLLPDVKEPLWRLSSGNGALDCPPMLDGGPGRANGHATQYADAACSVWAVCDGR